MSLRAVLFIIVAAIISVFTALNWNLIAQPAMLDFGFMNMQAPLGLILVGMMILLTILFLFYIAYLQTTVLLDARKNSKALEEQRKLADQAESSRFTDLRKFLQDEVSKLEHKRDTAQLQLMSRIDRMETALTGKVQAIAPVAAEKSVSKTAFDLPDRRPGTGEPDSGIGGFAPTQPFSGNA